MIAERAPQGRPSFEYTKTTYRQAYEKVIGHRLQQMGLSWEADLSKAGNLSGELFIETGGNSKNKVPIFLPVKYRLPRRKSPENRHNIAQIYLFDPDRILEQIGGDYHITRERVRQQVKRAVLGIIPQAARIELNKLNFRKPASDTSRDRRSFSRGGITLCVKEAVEGGASLQDLRKMGFRKGQIVQARRSLSKRESPIDIPRAIKDWTGIMSALQDVSTPRTVLCELIKQIDKSTLTRYKAMNVFESLFDLARKSGLYPGNKRDNNEFIAEYLASRNFPIRIASNEIKNGKRKGHMQVYRFGLRRLEEEGINLLRSAQGERFDQMRKPPFKAIGPIPDRTPTTMDLQKHDSYSSVLPLLRKFEVNNSALRSLGVNLSKLITDSPPVTVFAKGSGFLVANSDRDKLRKFLGERLRLIKKSRNK